MHATITLFACAGQLFLAFLAAWRGARSPLGMPLSLLAVTQCSWGICSAIFEFSGQPQWQWISLTAAPMGLPIALHFVLAFVGRRRSLAWLMFTTYGVVTVFAAIPAIGAAAAVGLTVAGQQVASVFVDKFGWFRLPKRPVSGLRLAGVALLLAGDTR